MLYPMVSKYQIRSKVEIEQNNSQVAKYHFASTRDKYRPWHDRPNTQAYELRHRAAI